MRWCHCWRVCGIEVSLPDFLCSYASWRRRCRRLPERKQAPCQLSDDEKAGLRLRFDGDVPQSLVSHCPQLRQLSSLLESHRASSTLTCSPQISLFSLT